MPVVPAAVEHGPVARISSGRGAHRRAAEDGVRTGKARKAAKQEPMAITAGRRRRERLDPGGMGEERDPEIRFGEGLDGVETRREAR